MNIPRELNEPVLLWTLHNSRKITAATLLENELYSPQQIEVFLLLLQQFRHRVRSVRFVRVGRPGGLSAEKHMMEQRIRDEVHDRPDKFTCYELDLEDYHPVHVAEMIVIVLSRLKSIGIDATNSNTAPARAQLAMPKRDANGDIIHRPNSSNKS